MTFRRCGIPQPTGWSSWPPQVRCSTRHGWQVVRTVSGFSSTIPFSAAPARRYGPHGTGTRCCSRFSTGGPVGCWSCICHRTGVPPWDTAIRAIETELSDRQEGYRQAAVSHLTLLLIDVARMAGDVVEDLTRAGEPLLADVFAVIERRHAEPLSLREVADEIGMTPGHLTTVVRRRTGRTGRRMDQRTQDGRGAHLARGDGFVRRRDRAPHRYGGSGLLQPDVPTGPRHFAPVMARCAERPSMTSSRQSFSYSDRGSPNQLSAPPSNRVIALIRSAARVSTSRPAPWQIPPVLARR